GKGDININDIYQGAGDYKIFFSTGNGFFGVKDDNKIVEIINWLDSDINSYSVRNIISLEDGDFIAYVEDYDSNDSAGFVRLTKRNADELANQTVITVGMLYSDQAITSKITEFNKSHTDYRIKIADYSKYNEYNEEQEKMTNSAQKQLKMDIVSGNAPDMIVTYDYSLIAELAPHGTYADLSTYLEKDDDLSEDDIMPNIIKASTIKGKLYSLAPTFNVETMACKSKFFDEENWTIDDFIDTMHDNKDMKITRYGNTKDTAFSILAPAISSFVDFDKAECDFNSEDFKKILEFCNEFPDESEEINWETATDDEMQKYWNEQDTLLMEDKALLDSIYFSELTEFTTEKNAYFGGEDITLVGIPSTDGKGATINMQNSFAILDSSPSKDTCWEFIKEFFTEDYQASDTNHYIWGLPTLVSAFEKKAESAMHKPYYIDDDGNKVEYDNSYYINNKEIKIDPLTEEEKDFIVDYIKKADKIYTDGAGDDINEIISTEVQKYFKGESTSQQACDMIQNRVSILLSEQS
ncbi:MAG: extracellular solute-binding protein, partial [Ruminococcus sp.]|nr:extracellular solute-binding protein [Ruminococcus sp.]